MYWTTFKRCDSSIGINEFVAVAVDNFIYSFGGGGSEKNEPIDIHVLNTNTLKWSLLPDRIDINGGKRLKPPNVPVERIGHSVVAYDKKIYLWGGDNYEIDICNTLYCFDTETLNWSRPNVSGIKPSPRSDHAACISNHVMYIFGGCDLYTWELWHDVYCLDLKTMNWSTIITTGEIPSPTHYSAAIVNNRMYILPFFDSIPHRDTMYLDLELNRWHRLEATGCMQEEVSCYRLVVHNNIIYAFGVNLGYDLELYYFDTKQNHWNFIKPLGKSPQQKEEQSRIILGDKMFLLSSIRQDAVLYRNTIHVLDFNPSLKTLAFMANIENGLDSSDLPKELRSEIDSMRQDLAQEQDQK